VSNNFDAYAHAIRPAAPLRLGTLAAQRSFLCCTSRNGCLATTGGAVQTLKIMLPTILGRGYSGLLIRATLLYLALAVSSVFAASNSPVPSAGKSISQQKAHSAQANQTTPEIQRGSESEPFFVQSVPGAESPDETDHKKYERHEKPTLERLMGWGTFWLAIFTLLLVIGTAVLAVFTYRLWRDARVTAAASVKDTQESLRIAAQSADAARLIARAAIGIELPILRILPPDMIAMSEPIVDGETYGGYVNDGLPTQYSGLGYFKCTNYGRTPAFPISFSCGWQVAATLPEPPIFIETAQINHAVVYRPEQDSAEPATIDAHFTIEVSDQEIEAIKKGGTWLWFYGCLYYEDFLGDRHNYRFCWRWADRNPPSGNQPFYTFASDGAPPGSYFEKKFN
jgi:hypothetical protein